MDEEETLVDFLDAFEWAYAKKICGKQPWNDGTVFELAFLRSPASRESTVRFIAREKNDGRSPAILNPKTKRAYRTKLRTSVCSGKETFSSPLARATRS